MTGLDADRHARAGTLASATLALEAPLYDAAEYALDSCHLLRCEHIMRPARATRKAAR